MRCESTLCAILALSSFFILACAPLLVRWRWGLPASLLYAAAAVALLFGASSHAIANWIAPPLPDPSDCGDEARGLGEFMLLFLLPAASTLVGAGLAALWSLFAVSLRFAKLRRTP
jgi:hypothetical protein